ncbi:hypothetical protein [Terribacillus saccharophilus]|uniref:hypothetical protein n=1 Tax=Terribacillus saccharophilus TaxID=361277 RepID=UPI003D2D5DC6
MSYVRSVVIGIWFAFIYLVIECYGQVLILPIDSAPLGWLVTFSNDVVRLMIG